ncbi:ribonuclease H [Galbitalea sp. SE-J8]|uniref:ribonuclease H family protein n=1 Tax=Galbitalea sp. SE-J8 TaxID=3054952 RepID=UPI00259C9D9A|nr:ribonuclease H [Galbitalea sp. SE-J8]MDM4762649.1 ribonuclease H [Galbitalea sp. SE-J8]
MTITAAADGSALGNPGPAGWAWYIDEEHWAAGGWPHATNNRGELTAVLELFRATAHTGEDLHVLCDSQYVINCITKWMPGWKRKGWRKADGAPVLNVDLLRELDAAIEGREYRFEWVKGHVGHVLNEAADARARAVAEAYRAKRDIPTGPGFGAGAPEPPELAAAELDAVTGDDNGSPTADESGADESGAEEGGAEETDPTDAVLDADDALFTLEPDLHEVTVLLTDEEWARLTAQARSAGVSVEELVRSRIGA